MVARTLAGSVNFLVTETGQGFIAQVANTEYAIRDAIKAYTAISMSLLTDDEQALPFVDVENANFISVNANRSITLSVTSADGTEQRFSAQQMLLKTERPFTAINIQRTPGVLTEARIFIGESA